VQSLAAALGTLGARGHGILGRRLTETELEQFAKYLQLLQKWQRVQRLIGSSDPGWIVEQLFLDSLMFLQVLPRGLTSLCDVGSGAGLPGIPIKIVSRELPVTLLESRQRRVSFLSEAVRVLDLGTTSVESTRAEAAPERLLGSFAAVVLRCAGPIDELVPVVSRLVSPGGVIVCSGPPERHTIPPGGEWREAVDPPAGRRRLFAVFHV